MSHASLNTLPDLQTLLALCEQDLPEDCQVLVGRCSCGNPAGKYRAIIAQPGQRMGVSIDLLTMSTVPLVVGGFEADYHDESMVAALAKAYAAAVEHFGKEG